MSYSSLLILICTIEQKTNSQNSTGSLSETWTTKASNVKTRKVKNLQPKIYDELTHTYIDDYAFYFLLGTSIAVKDRISLGGEVYEILSVDNDSHNHHVKVFAKKTKQ